ncbi:PREDICTED: uncharacterized protein LOC108360765 isoform X1 [Rhagoletis zephyria]|uniref:uncharacterized protein LOC108360765 isoform X1 n=1 Tax=Rhagoletis zephyria TaxID=28612 RepID=UPI0008116CD0|nr:PREDICTED: uncharacterized protein LOC108360765 isoform X1 [Rhagoletis zephyria]XP_017468680.1 PREDICTED: uncharacterized protein LOC108360765 isoform X1 [Rhagoletis zephyria]XP_036330194.1 uncharacterized protein LOC118742317 isoform X1 [Rhagoletis pomonella]XP_036330195.1 uncharacterized protein LOC118742317 isoform X1 [Rhagoletis pomonella]
MLVLMANKWSLCISTLTWLTLLSVTNSVRITNLKVPHTYTLDRNTEPDPLVLDCEYEVEPREKGFVLKWLFNNHSIYQWIPSVKGFAMGIMKSKIDTKIFTMEGSPGVITIKKPDWNMTGEYTCTVQTFESTDKKSARLQIIVPESDFVLETKMDGEQSGVDIMCAVQNVFPQPILSVIFDTKIIDSILTQTDQNSSGLYSTTVRTRIPRDKLESPTPITCAFFLLGTNYTKRRETIFYDKATNIQRKWTTVAVVISIASLTLSS